MVPEAVHHSGAGDGDGIAEDLRHENVLFEETMRLRSDYLHRSVFRSLAVPTATSATDAQVSSWLLTCRRRQSPELPELAELPAASFIA